MKCWIQSRIRIKLTYLGILFPESLQSNQGSQNLFLTVPVSAAASKQTEPVLLCNSDLTTLVWDPNNTSWLLTLIVLRVGIKTKHTEMLKTRTEKLEIRIFSFVLRMWCSFYGSSSGEKTSWLSRGFLTAHMSRGGGGWHQPQLATSEV